MSGPSSPLSQNLRKWRTRRGLSVSALARESGVSKSTVSELERANGNPSLDTLWALARALSISLGALFAAPGAPGDPEVLRIADASIVVDDGESFIVRLLANWPSEGEVELCVVDLAAAGRRDSKGNAAGVVERAVCVEGIVEIGTAAHSVVLRVGDMITFAADQPHFYLPIDGPARLVVVQQYPYLS